VAPLLAISPHLDDAVFGAGERIAAHPQAMVVTVFAGRPPAGTPLTPWDRDAGFDDADDVIGARREEDRTALRALGARPVWLDFRDAQYGPTPAVEAVADVVEAAVVASGAPTVLAPLGLFHGDHHLTHAAALAVARRRPRLTWLLYEEPMYRLVPGLVDARLAGLGRAGLRPRPCPALARSDDRRAAKRRAVAAYRSQLRALATPGRPGWADALAPERCWRVTPR